MGKYKVSIIIALISSCLFLASCASHQKYPSEWAELILPQDERCLDISGTYMNLGERGDKQGAFLTTLFDFEETPSTAIRVQVTQSDTDTLEISAWYEQTVVSRKVYSKGNKQYSCSSKGVEIPIGERGEAAGGEKRTILYLAKSKDGALVIERKSSAGGYSLLYIPMVGSRYEWYRFNPIEIRKSKGAFFEKEKTNEII